jgi:hypothetical protein
MRTSVAHQATKNSVLLEPIPSAVAILGRTATMKNRANSARTIRGDGPTIVLLQDIIPAIRHCVVLGSHTRLLASSFCEAEAAEVAS